MHEKDEILKNVKSIISQALKVDEREIIFVSLLKKRAQ